MTIHLDASQVPASLRGSYTGRAFKAEVSDSCYLPATAGLWDGGSRESYFALNLATGERKAASFQSLSPMGADAAARQASAGKVTIPEGFAIVRHSVYMGRDMGLTFYIRPENASALLPVADELPEESQIFLAIVATYKSAYRAEYWARKGIDATRAAELKAALAAGGYLTAAGAITVKGRNAAEAAKRKV